MSDIQFKGITLADRFNQSFLVCARENEFGNETNILERINFRTALDVELFLGNLDSNKNAKGIISSLYACNHAQQANKDQMVEQVIFDLTHSNLLIYSITDLQPLFQTGPKLKAVYQNDLILKKIEEEEEAVNWLKINFGYNDLWQTPIPLEGVVVYVDNVQQGGKHKLNEGSVAPTKATKFSEADNSTDEAGSVVIKGLPLGKVDVYVEPEEGLEKQIKDEVEDLTRTLDGAYYDVVDKMSGFREDWEENGYFSLIKANAKGGSDGMSSWVEGQGELLELDTWKNLADKFGNATSKAWDVTADYASERYDALETSYNNVATHITNGDVIKPTFWMGQADQAIDEVKGYISDAEQLVDGAIQNAEEVMRYASVISEHIDEIMKLPDFIAHNDVNAIENFIDTVVMELDPELANEIKNDPDFHISLALLDDSDASLTYLAYVSLFFEAIPPNFYAYSIAKVGGYLLLEAMLMLLLALVSGPAGTGARITMLTAKLAAESATIAKTANKIKHAETAVKAFADTINVFGECAGKLKSIGLKLSKTRHAHNGHGNTNGTVDDKKESTKREGRCRICHSTKHHTPASKAKIGEVEIA